MTLQGSRQIKTQINSCPRTFWTHSFLERHAVDWLTCWLVDVLKRACLNAQSVTSADQLIITAANELTPMLIALMRLSSALHIRPHYHATPLPRAVSAFSQPLCRLGICRRIVRVCVSVHTRVQLYCSALCQRASIQPHAICILLAVCCVESVFSLSAACHETYATMKSSQLKNGCK